MDPTWIWWLESGELKGRTSCLRYEQEEKDRILGKGALSQKAGQQYLNAVGEYVEKWGKSLNDENLIYHLKDLNLFPIGKGDMSESF